MATQAPQQDEIHEAHQSDLHGDVRKAIDCLNDVLTVQQTVTQRAKSLRDARDAVAEALDIAERDAERDDVRRQIQSMLG